MIAVIGCLCLWEMTQAQLMHSFRTIKIFQVVDLSVVALGISVDTHRKVFQEVLW